MISFQVNSTGKLTFSTQPARGAVVRVAPFGAGDIGEPRPCLVAPGEFVVHDGKGNLVTARTERGLRGAAARLGLIVDAAIWLP